MENRPLVKSMLNYIGDLSGVFSMSSSNEVIDDAISRF